MTTFLKILAFTTFGALAGSVIGYLGSCTGGG